MHFLDRFVYRSPKTTDDKRGGSIMQPVLATGNSSHAVVSNRAGMRRHGVVNSASFWNLKAEEVSPEDVFFHQYFAKIGKPTEAARAKKDSKDGTASDDEAEAEIWDALVKSRPEVEGGDLDEDSDIDMDGYEDSDGDLEDGILTGHDGMSHIGSDDAPFEGIFEDSDVSGDESADDEGAEAEGAEGVSLKDERRGGRLNRKEMKALPTFASADEYAEMLAGEGED